jgi:hypothetical protein
VLLRLGALALVGAIVVACVPGRSGPAILTGGAPVLVAKDLSWSDAFLQLPVGQPLPVTVDNQDPGIPHGFAIHDPDDRVLFRGEIVVGPARTEYSIPALGPGSYIFLCPVHPNMQGKLVVTG